MRPEADRNTVLKNQLRVFQDYVGIKLHFNGDITWQPHMEFKLGYEQLLKRNDAFCFMQLADQFSREENIQKLVSMFKQSRTSWIGEIFEEEKVDFHKKRMSVINSLKYVVRSDIDRIIFFMEENKIDVRTLLLSDGQSPYIITNQSDIIGGVTDETLALFEKAFRFCSQPTIDPLWEDRKFMLAKYSSWIDVDSEFLKQQLDKLVRGKV